MSGYRTSSFDPDAVARAGRPMRPFNWVQWSGVAFGVASLLVDALYFTGQFGWIRPIIGSPAVAIALLVPAIILINSRRYPPDDPADREQAARNRRMLALSIFVITMLLAAATFITFSGVR